MSNLIHETDRFQIYPFEIEDLNDNYKSWFLDPEVTKHNSHGLFPYTEDQEIEMLDMANEWKETSLPKNIIWAVWANDIIGHIGNVALNNIDYINRNAEFTCIFGEKEFWGKGYGTETARLIFDYGFNKLNLNRIYLGTVITNEGMIRIAEKLGMTKEGTLSNHVFLNGIFMDVCQYGILKSEWKWGK